MKRREESQLDKKDFPKEDVEMGEFEDVYEDEMEEEIMEAESEEEEIQDEEMQVEQEKEPQIKVYLPGQALEKDEMLDYDPEAYHFYHALNSEWPCLSFDILPDSMGNDRITYPMTMYFVSGTQAESADKNQIQVMKASQLHKMRHEDEDMAEDNDDEEEVDEDPVLEYRQLNHPGGVNRIRRMPNENVHVVSTWSELGQVHIWDLTRLYKSLESNEFVSTQNPSEFLLYTNEKHSTEGFAMDWLNGKLVTGDMKGEIYLTTCDANGNWLTEPTPFLSHTKSVEDLQWSPSQDFVFASCSADQTIQLWDTRDSSRRSKISIHAHQSDVNVMSWHPKVKYLLVSGADDGSFSVWDLRSLKQPVPQASFQWHRAQITSIEWHPTDESVLAVSGADDQITIWDLSVELDAEEEQSMEMENFPSQLMFIHQGQQNVKELHWHPQCPGVLLSTAASGFNLFKPINL